MTTSSSGGGDSSDCGAAAGQPLISATQEARGSALGINQCLEEKRSQLGGEQQERLCLLLLASKHELSMGNSAPARLARGQQKQQQRTSENGSKLERSERQQQLASGRESANELEEQRGEEGALEAAEADWSRLASLCQLEGPSKESVAFELDAQLLPDSKIGRAHV